MPTISDMAGRAALVTGAAAGLGRATALLLARAGAAVSLVDIDEAGLAETARLIAAEGAGQGLPDVVDLGRRDACFAAVERAAAAHGRLDALCNVAGVMFPAHTPQMSEEHWSLTMAVNLAAPFFLIQAALPHLLEAHGAIVNVTSCAAFRGQSYFAAYCAAKAGLTNMTKSLAMEYVHAPIRINAVAPGGMMTTLTGNMKLIADGDPALLRRLGALRGMVEIEQVAAMVAFLATPAAEGYHGACINIDNGVTAD